MRPPGGAAVLGDVDVAELRHANDSALVGDRHVGVENAIRFFLGIDITAITPFNGTTLVLGESELSIYWELCPSDQFARYAFDVEVDIPLTATERSQIRAIVDYLKPAHTHFVGLVEPSPPAFIDRWELGSSELGVTTELHG